ncbi:MAG: lysophospholipid acyltransferase family protein [Candidatus Thiodiazotropha sp. (ex Lucina aurantia)]|nr:lysophospholipid acyltransferase family protein [Candidatus Thiodiazotropha taylori]MBV2097664.1 lysophospholipid acyltransferase family protein [Candidatus Thiodiazotropha sp. (ex Codakia orbicularis)]MBV2101961.1 lysophospholipid acyltransferase family protein [Candidatus Thiodiazotropha sp. (ex Lucina aurantia)]MBV2117059.1 lysophospholipid acyltransferase family protein [Candidatus Thiodiazotropha sp. (ex Lucina aurantia)]
MLNVEQVLTERFPGFFNNKPQLLTKPMLTLLRMLFHEREINRFLEDHQGLRGLDFIEKVLEYFDLDYLVSNRDLENIPPTGRVVVVANHPLGALDALSLILMISRVRTDIRVVANDLLSALEPLGDLLLPVDNMGGSSSRKGIKQVYEALEREEMVIVFPAGEVSRLRPNGVRDVRWKNGFLQFIRRTEAPMLPIFIDAKNSPLFYAVSLLYKPIAALLLVGEMFHQRSNTIGFRIGGLVPAAHLNVDGIRPKARVRMVRKHFYRVAQRKPGIFTTERSIAHPESRQALKKELSKGRLLGETRDGKQIVLMDWEIGSALMREIGRLRELSFRKVGEGTGRRRDIDKYDTHYRHLVLWDDNELEVVGSYRIGEAGPIINDRGMQGLYTTSLFDFDESFQPYAERAIELGRSFVQPRYWGSRALDYLWQGLGSYLRHHPEIHHMYGPVSISDRYPKAARDLMVVFYKHYFGCKSRLGEAKIPYQLDKACQEEFSRHFCGDDLERDLQELKNQLALYNVTIPTLFKQYTDLCEPGGVCFLDFGKDPDFAGCTDGMILVSVDKVKSAKRKRYIGD